MDVAEEIPHHRVKPRVDGETEQPADAVSKVLDDGNLLREIIVRVGFPTTLVRAGLVSRRWRGHASDPAFLSRFRKAPPTPPPRLLHIRVLGLLEEARCSTLCPDAASAPRDCPRHRHLDDFRFGADDGSLEIKHCKNGTIFTERYKRGTKLTLGVHRPLYPERGMPIVPPFPCVQDSNLQLFSTVLSKEGGDGGLSYFYLLGTKESGTFMVRVYVLQDGVWRTHLTLTTDQPHRMNLETKAVLVDNKICMSAAYSGYIIVLDLTASSLSTIQLPQGVTHKYFKTMLSPANDVSGVYLIHVKKFHLCIWLYKGDNWSPVDSICLKMLDHTLGDNHGVAVLIEQVGDDAEFVFLRMGGCTLYLDVRSKTLRKVHETAEMDQGFSVVSPFMMIWPPIFPVLKDDPARIAM